MITKIRFVEFTQKPEDFCFRRRHCFPLKIIPTWRRLEIMRCQIGSSDPTDRARTLEHERMDLNREFEKRGNALQIINQFRNVLFSVTMVTIPYVQ